MTQYELGEKLNYSDKAISKWERGESIPDAYILKKMSELFHVSVDYLLSEHSEKEKKFKMPHSNHSVIAKISIAGIWTAAILTFVVLWILDRVEWLVFVYPVPISLIVLLVFNSVWGKFKNNFYIISALLWCIIGTVYLTLIDYNWWIIFILGVPSEINVYLCFKLKRRPKI
ncbi:hypothetical protein SDC9_150519 [bioreactor metagenome]|uniref:HTH cro/C1-type domain-containing protein n=1 Tax=bioreactor metagenome TaxID=1076179 RepID=A0A645EPU3_9ZZZZ